MATDASREALRVMLNIAEGWRRMGRDRRQHYLIAAGSTRTCRFPASLAKLQDWQRGWPQATAVHAELRAALDVSEALGYLDSNAYAELDALLDRVSAMLYRLTR